MGMIEILYGKHYNIYEIIADCSDQGHSGLSRLRIFVICAHKVHTTMLCDPVLLYDKITAVVKKYARTEPKDYLVSDRYEILREAADLAIVRKKQVRAVT